MRKTILLLLCLWLGIGLQAQTLTISPDGKTASISGSTAGCLVGTTVLSAAQKTTVTSLTITSGAIDASDINIMKVTMAALVDIDLSGATILAYTGTAGTNGATSQAYPANTVPARAFYYIGRLKTFKTPSTATAFASQAFCWANSMTSLSIPSSLTTFGASALFNCSAIVTVDPANTIFASDAYGVVYGLTGTVKTSIYSVPSSTTLSTVDYTVPTGVTTIVNQAFEMNNFHSITLSSSVTTIGTYAFEACNAATIYIPSSVASIGTGAFLNSPSVVTVDPANTKFASDATYGIVYGLTTGKTSVVAASTSTTFSGLDYTIPSTVTSIAANAFSYNNLHSVTTTSVTNVGIYAFSNCNIPSVSILSPVTVMGANAFNAANTTSVNLTGVINISGANVFSASKITSLALSSSLTTIGGNGLSGISNLTSISIPASVTTMGAGPFWNSSCIVNVDAANPNYSSDAFGVLFDKNKTTLISAPSSLTGSYTIPGTVTSIAGAAFYYSKLTSITIPSSVTSIATLAFQNAATANLTQIHAQGSIPANITLAATIFSGLSAAKVSIWVADAATVALYKAAAQWLAYPVVREMPASIAVATPGTLSTLVTAAEQLAWTGITVTGTLDARDFKFLNGMTKLTSVDLSGVTSIETYTGTGGPVATSTVYPANEIPQYSFNAKILTTNIVLPACITSIGQYAFKGTAITTMNSIPDAVTSIGVYAFNACTALQTVHLPTSLTAINSYLFQGCANLTTVNIPSQITLVDASAFSGCLKLNSALDIPSTVTSIGVSAFQDCNALTTVTLHEGALTTIPATAFYNCTSLTSIAVPSTVTAIGASAFKNCTSLISASLPMQLQLIDFNTFYGCSSLKSITLPTALTAFGGTCFSGCTSLTSIVIPSGVQTLSYNTFQNCTALATATLPAQLKTFDLNAWANASPFTGCYNLESVSIDPSNIYYATQDGALYDKNKTILVYCPTGRKGAFTLPSTVITVGQCSMMDCKGLTAFSFGTSAPVTLESNSFKRCTGLTTITIPASVTTLASSQYGGPFYGCDNLQILYAAGGNFVTVDGVTFTADMKTIVSCVPTKAGDYVIPDGVTTIKPSAFATCVSLTSVTMPSSVTSIGSFAFLSCTGLTSVSLSSNLKTIPYQGFWGCSSLKSVVIPAGVTTIEGQGFKNAGLRSVTLPEGLTYIGENAFLSTYISIPLVLPKSLKTVGAGAFASDFLLSIEFPAGFEKFEGDGVFWNQVRTLKMNNTTPIDITMALAFATPTLKNNAALIVPAGSKAKYQAAPGWKDFKNIIEDGSAVNLTVTSVAGGLSAAIRAQGASIVNVKKLTVNGNINAIDIKMMRDSMLLTSDIDLSAVSIDAIATATTLGTLTTNVTYAANTLPQNSFVNCKRVVNSLILPNNITTVDASAFYSARGIKSVYIPASVTVLGANLTYDNFILYTVDPASTTFMSDGAAIYNKAQTTLVVLSNAVTGSYTIAPTTTTIQGYAFYGAQLTSVVVPASVVNIAGYYTFSGNTALSYISYSKTPTALQGTTFYMVNGASKLYVPMGTKSLYMAQTTWSSNFGTDRIIEMASVEKAITAGGLEAALTTEEKASLTKLKLTGEMDARDFKFIRDNLPLLTSIDLAGVTIAALPNSTDGTGGNTSISYPANVIPMSAFLNKNIVDSIALPVGVDSISINAFNGCKRLAYIQIPGSVTAIASNGFTGCDKLENVSIPNVSSLGSNVFAGCSYLKSVTMTGVTSMGSNVFTNCPSLASVTIPSAISTLPAGTFANCSSLSSVSIPGVTVIASEAFLGCIKLASVDLSSVTSMGRAAFSACTGLTSLTVPNVTTVADNTFAGCTGLTSLVIPSTVTSLSAYSFLNCIRLTTVTIPKEVTYIAPTAFQGCTGLLLTMEAGGNYFVDTDGVIFTSAARTALVSCPTSKAGSFVIPSSVTEIKSGAFAGCYQLTTVILPTSLNAIPDSAFMDCSSLETVTFNAGLTSIGKSAFENCAKLVSYEIPSTVASIGASAFAGNSMLEKINIPSALTTITNRMFYKCPRLINLTIPENVTTIEAEAFAGYYVGGGVGLGNFVLPVATVNIAANAFWGAAITTITVKNPTPIAFAESNVFYGISKNTPLIVPVGTVDAYKAAAQWNEFNFILEPSELTIAVTPGELTNLLTPTQKLQVAKLTLTGTMDARDFQCMKTQMIGLMDIDLSGVSIVAYTGTEGTGGTTSQTYPANAIPTFAMGPLYKTVVLPPTINNIGSYAFYNCNLITSLVLPESVTTIDYAAMNGCSRLANINIPAAVTSIGDGAFYGCSTLPSITIPEGTASIGAQTFQNCINLTSVGLPSTVTSIGTKAFMSCEKLKTILIYANVNTIGGYAFANCAGLDTVYAKPATPIALGLNTGATPYVFYGMKSTCTLRVPEDSKAAYVSADQWKEFGADNTIEEAWFGKKVIFSFNGVAPTVKRGDGKTIVSGTKVVEGTILTFAANHPANYVQTLKSAPIGSSVYTYYAPTAQTATSGLTDIPVTDNVVFTLTIDPAAVWNGANNSSWNTPDNWSSHYVPTEFDDVVINLGSNTTVAGDNSSCHNLTINSGSVNVPAGKMLTVTGSITNNTDVNGLIVKADETGILPNGTLIFQNAPTSPFLATVEMYSKSTTDLGAVTGSKYNWQHFGIPVRNYDMSNPGLDGVFVREYKESGATQAAQWSMKSYDDVLSSFKGYEIAPNANQPGGIKHNFTGELENRNYQSGLLGYTPGALNQGYNLLANPYTAAINMSSINYGADMLQTVYLYSSGSINAWSNWNSTEPKDTTNANTAGQYVAVPKLLSGVGGLPATIPSMQAFVVRANGNVNNSIEIPYAASVIKNTELQRVRRVQTEPVVSTKILVTGASKKADCMWIFSNADCTHGFDNGYDGEKMLGSALSPQIYAAEATGNYQVNSVNDINNTEIGFKAGSDTNYTLTFTHSNLDARYAALYLVDLQNNVTTDITASGSQYRFTITNPTVASRFKIVTSTSTTTEIINPSDSQQLKVFASKNLIFVQNLSSDNGYVELYNTAGQYLQKLPFNANGITTLPVQLTSGSYVVKAIIRSNRKVVERIIINN
jgi:hypothetical protein